MSVLALKPQYVFRGQWKAGVTLQGLWEHHSKPLFHAVINEMANSGGGWQRINYSCGLLSFMLYGYMINTNMMLNQNCLKI